MPTVYEITDVMKYAAAYEGFILFHILPIEQNISQSEGLFHIAKQYFIKYAIK